MKKDKEKKSRENRELKDCLACVRAAEKCVLKAEVKMALALAGISIVLGIIFWACVMVGNGRPLAWIAGILCTGFMALYITRGMLKTCMKESLAMRRQAFSAVKRFCNGSGERALTLFLRYASTGHMSDDERVPMLRNVAEYLTKQLPPDTAEEMYAYIDTCPYGFLSAFRIRVDPESIVSICQGAKVRKIETGEQIETKQRGRELARAAAIRSRHRS